MSDTVNKLIDFIISILRIFKFWFVIEPWEHGFTFHLGKPGSSIGYDDGLFGTGLHLIFPFYVTRVRNFDITEESAEPPVRDLMTSDGHLVRVAGVFRYKVRPERAYEFLCVLGEDWTTVMDHFLGAAIAEVVEHLTKDELFSDTSPGEEMILEEARRHLNRYGFKWLDFNWTERAVPARVYRLITDPNVEA